MGEWWTIEVTGGLVTGRSFQGVMDLGAETMWIWTVEVIDGYEPIQSGLWLRSHISVAILAQARDMISSGFVVFGFYSKVLISVCG